MAEKTRQWERGRKKPLKRKSQCPAVPRTPAKVPRVTRTSTTKSVRTWCLGPEGLGTSGALAPQPCGPPALAHSPQDVVDTHDALRLQVAGVVDDRPLRLQPHVAPVLRKHPVLAANRLASGANETAEMGLRAGRWGTETPQGGRSGGKRTGLGLGHLTARTHRRMSWRGAQRSPHPTLPLHVTHG